MKVTRFGKVIYVTFNSHETESGCEVMKVKDGDGRNGLRLTLGKTRELIEKLNREVQK